MYIYKRQRDSTRYERRLSFTSPAPITRCWQFNTPIQIYFQVIKIRCYRIPHGLILIYVINLTSAALTAVNGKPPRMRLVMHLTLALVLCPQPTLWL